MFELCTRNVEFRAADEPDSDGRTLEGYAAVFDQDTEINSMFEGKFFESISSGAFKKTLREKARNVLMQWNHGRDTRVGETPIGVYEELTEDIKGLKVKGRLFDNQVVEPVRQAIEAGAINGMSFKFRVVRDEWRDNSGKLVRGPDLEALLWEPGERGPLHRRIKEVQLFEAGPVSQPAYGGTSVGVRSLTDDEREQVVLSYRATMQDVEEEDEQRLADWLDAESVYEEERDAWLNAERTYQWLWLEAEAKYRADNPQKPYGDVTYADPGYQKDKKKRYPLDSKEHVKAAWSYINMPKNAAKYSPDQVSKIKGKIKSAAKKFGVEIGSEKKSASVSDAVLRDTSQPASGNHEQKPVEKTTSERGVNDETKPTRKDKRAMNIHELRAREGELLASLAGLTEEYRDAEMPAEQSADFDAAESELGEVRASMKAIEERAARMAAYAAKAPETREHGSDSGPAFHKEHNVFDLDATRMDSNSPEDFVERITDDALRFAEKARVPRHMNVEGARERMQELIQDYDDDSGTLAKRFLITGSPVYERAFGKALKATSTAGLSNEEQRALALGAGGTGGFAVPVQLDPTVILTSPGVVGDIRSVARVETIVGKQWQGITSDGVTVSRDAEAQEVSDDSPTLVQPTVDASRVAGFVPFSYEIDQDWGALRAEISRMLNDAKIREEASAFAVGNGTPPNPQGVITGATAVSLGTGTATAAGFKGKLPDALYALEAAVDPRWRANGTFMANKAVFNQVRMVDTNGGANLWERIGAGLPSQLIGYPIIENHAMNSDFATTSRVLAFGDFKQFLIVDRIGMNVELIPNLVGANFRPTGQRGIFALWRNGSKLLVPAAIKVYTTLT